MITKDHCTEAEALRIFRNAECVAGSQDAAVNVGHHGPEFSAGLVRREDEARVQRTVASGARGHFHPAAGLASARPCSAG